MCMKQKNVIIVAGGSGKRMGAEIPKQFLKLAGKPILMHSIEAFFSFDSAMQIIVVLPLNQHDYWAKLITEHKFEVKHKLAKGGPERFYSVKNGLQLIESGLVAVHDGVRPFASKETISRCFSTCETDGAVVPVIPANESIRRIIDGTSEAVNRSHYFMVQTPQVFETGLLKKAYEQEFNTTFTDDASVVEKMGTKITTVEGNPENIKITQPMDLKIAEVLIAQE